MVCFKPLHAKKIQLDTGKNAIVFPHAWKGEFKPPLEVMQSDPHHISLACGQCQGCRVARSRDWAMRCMHELQSHTESCFITLTYDDAHLPHRGTLVKKHFQDFMKRLRRHLGGKKIKYYMCGEYGDVNGRPHYHAIIFGHDFMDKHPIRRVRGHTYYISPDLRRLWPCGLHVIGEVTYESCAYVARYILKKVVGKEQWRHYKRTDANGKPYFVVPEYTNMSLKTSIGREWCGKYIDDCLPSGYLIKNGMKVRVPKFYLKVFEIIAPERYAAFKRDQQIRMSILSRTDSYRKNHSEMRLAQRLGHFLYKIKKLMRQL